MISLNSPGIGGEDDSPQESGDDEADSDILESGWNPPSLL